MSEFVAWPKIPRGTKQEVITITEKIDGTNACIIVEEGIAGPLVVGVQSRKRLIEIHDDNYGFANYVEANKDDLAAKLGEGYHYGEWAGEGIQKNPHGMVGKHFLLFNSDRWRDGRQERPSGVLCVPVLYEGPAVNEMGEDMIDVTMTGLLRNYAYEAEGIHPEGVVVWYCKSRRYEKHTFAMSEGKWKL